MLEQPSRWAYNDKSVPVRQERGDLVYVPRSRTEPAADLEKVLVSNEMPFRKALTEIGTNLLMATPFGIWMFTPTSWTDDLSPVIQWFLVGFAAFAAALGVLLATIDGYFLRKWFVIRRTPRPAIEAYKITSGPFNKLLVAVHKTNEQEQNPEDPINRQKRWSALFTKQPDEPLFTPPRSVTSDRITDELKADTPLCRELDNLIAVYCTEYGEIQLALKAAAKQNDLIVSLGKRLSALTTVVAGDLMALCRAHDDQREQAKQANLEERRKEQAIADEQAAFLQAEDRREAEDWTNSVLNRTNHMIES